jgi:hypothetical protein
MRLRLSVWAALFLPYFRRYAAIRGGCIISTILSPLCGYQWWLHRFYHIVAAMRLRLSVWAALFLPYCRRYAAFQPCNGDIMVA